MELREQALRKRLIPARDGANALAALALLDNVERDLPIDRVLEALPALGITVLLTARHQVASPRLRLARLDVLEVEAAVQLFASRYADRGGAWAPERDWADAAEVVELLGRLPLAIERAAASAARSGGGVATLAAELRTADRLGKLRDPLDRAKSVRFVFENSLAQLDPLQRARFVALGLPAGRDWPRVVIDRLLSAIPTVPEQACAAGEDLEALAALSLVILAPAEPRGETPGASVWRAGRVRLHPLLRELAQQEGGREPAETRRAGVVALLAAVATVVDEHERAIGLLEREEDLIVGALRSAAQERVSPEQFVQVIDTLQ